MAYDNSSAAKDLHYWLKRRRAILHTVQGQVEQLRGESDPILAKLQHNYVELEQRSIRDSSPEELAASISTSSITLCSDFHSYARNQKFFLRLLERIPVGDEGRVVGLEALPTDCQTMVDRYLGTGGVSDEANAEMLDYLQTLRGWPLSPSLYLKILSLCAKRSWPVLTLYPRFDNLAARDSYMAEVLHRSTKNHTGQHLVLIGGFHLTEDSLYGLLRQQHQVTRLFIDPDEVYFRD